MHVSGSNIRLANHRAMRAVCGDPLQKNVSKNALLLGFKAAAKARTLAQRLGSYEVEKIIRLHHMNTTVDWGDVPKETGHLRC